ncbi:uncharacterized protein LOC106937119 isoform X2 [Poecilia latipinna]|uniref:uncharacterized protein LOC106937119 isoform X2 n=1 Tax=Poecilia latipinna TaxID=48699 RepID=UPI00072E1094|nr:PREDICTED: uncharacterized protein LOC106937119 isoform X2 [Poecilia latipinna]XP_016532156.1 PREDICTED: uncharacterized protein LOC107837390 isoform X2 [Poecilia formosa]
MDCLEDFSQCPACNKEYDVALILPCSHTICARCVAAEEETGSHPLCRSVCSVPCPCCRQPVELPCWTWSSAASCLPQHPTLRSEYANWDTGFKDGSARSHHEQEDSDCKSTLSSKRCSNVRSSFVLPVDGAVDLLEEEMERSVYVTYGDSGPSDPHPPIRKPALTPDSTLLLPHVSTDVTIARGQYYWEVDVCNSSVYRVGVISSDGCSGWWLERNVSAFHAVYDGSCEPIGTVPPRIKTLGIFLSFEGGILSFHNPLTQEHLVTLPTRFSPSGVLPALGLGQGKLRLHCGLPTPPYVFLGKDSTFRGPCGPNRVWWHRAVPFQSVKTVIQKFEKLASSD